MCFIALMRLFLIAGPARCFGLCIGRLAQFAVRISCHLCLVPLRFMVQRLLQDIINVFLVAFCMATHGGFVQIETCTIQALKQHHALSQDLLTVSLPCVVI